MARKSTTEVPLSPKVTLTSAQIERCMERIDERIAELENFSVSTLVRGTSPELQALIKAIEDTLERSFGMNTAAYQRFSGASRLQYVSSVYYPGMPTPDYAGHTKERIVHSIALLKEAKRSLEEDLKDLQSDAIPPAREGVNSSNRKVFLVHGHDESMKQTVARFLEGIEFSVVILHEQANGGKTIIEKFEKNSDVGFAVVLLTPDDVGGVKGGEMAPRARQNVILELGYFLGKLGRDRVCALLADQVEIPSDYAGVVWERFSGDWKAALGRELQEAGYVIDWNQIMGRR